jgi:hypothetical protein
MGRGTIAIFDREEDEYCIRMTRSGIGASKV